MNEQARARGPWQGRTTGPVIFMAVGILFLAVSTFILATTSSHAAGVLAALQALAIPSIPMGVMLFLLGLVNTTRNLSLRWLRISVSILCGILLGLAVLWFLLIFILLISGF